jgi:SAM-dependent methyltransferase
MREMAEMHFGRVAGPPHGKVLEVGCGGGQLLLNLRDVGWQATGLEIDEHAVRAARAHGLNVFQGGIATTEISETGFDLIILNHVIEHLSDPVGCLRKCAAMLVPNGRLVIVTPNSDGLSHRRFGHSWRGLEVPRHLVLFSPRSLEAAARAAGLVPRKVQTLIRAARFMHRQSSLMRTGANRIEIDHAMPLVERLIRLSGACLFQIAEWLTAIRDPNAGDEIYMELETLGVKGTHK